MTDEFTPLLNEHQINKISAVILHFKNVVDDYHGNPLPGANDFILGYNAALVDIRENLKNMEE